MRSFPRTRTIFNLFLWLFLFYLLAIYPLRFHIKSLFDFKAISRSITGYDSRIIPNTDDESLNRILYGESKPTLIYFYKSKHSRASRAWLPVLEELHDQFQDRFNVYQFNTSKGEIKFFEKYSAYDGILIMFKDGKEIGQFWKGEVIKGFFPYDFANKGMLFVFLNDTLGFFKTNSRPVDAPKYLSKENFEDMALRSRKPVIVNFEFANCPAADRFRPQFKAIAQKYSNIADFYFLYNDPPISSSKRRRIPWTEEQKYKSSLAAKYHVRIYPTLVMLLDGKWQDSELTYGEQSANEGIIVAMLLKHSNFTALEFVAAQENYQDNISAKTDTDPQAAVYKPDSDDPISIITLTSGAKLRGRIFKKTQERIFIDLFNIKISLPHGDILSIEEEEK